MTPSTLDIEITISKYFDFTRNIIVTSVRWGMHIHECDLLIMTKSRYLYEVEIKITKQDLLKDLKKRHQHRDRRIKHFYFAIPEKLVNCIEHIPERAGIIIIKWRKPFIDYRNNYHEGCFYCEEIKKPRNLSDYKCNDVERMKLLRLGALRIWSLKSRILKLKRRMR